MRLLPVLTALLIACPKAPPPPPVLPSAPLAAADPASIRVPAHAPVVGDPEAPVVIVMASDFACPHCARGWTTLTTGIDARRGVQLRIMPFPLSEACNIGKLDAVRCDLAVAASCAATQGRSRAAGTALFASPQAATIDDLPRTASLDAPTFRACLASAAAQERLLADIAEVKRAAAVTGVPTFWVFRQGGAGGLQDSSSPEDALAEADRLGQP